MKKITGLLFIVFSLFSFSQGNNDKAGISQKSANDRNNRDRFKGVDSTGSFVNGDISTENDELNKAIWVEEKFAGESKTCSFKEKTADFRIFDLGTRIGDDCYKLVDDHHAELQKMLNDKYEGSDNNQVSSLQYQADSDVIQMKMTKAKERCGQVLALNIQYAGARANWIYNIGVVSERKKCVKAWKKLSEKKGSCGKNQEASLAKFDKVYEQFDPVKNSEKVGQFVDFIGKLSKQNNVCSGMTLKSKEYHCGLFVKRLRKGHVVCNYSNPNEDRRSTLLENDNTKLYYFADSFAKAIADFILPSANAGTMWDEFKSMSRSVSNGLIDHDQRLAPYIYDPMVRGVTYQAIIDKKEKTAGTYDMIVLENYGRSNVVNDLKSDLETSTGPTTSSILDGVLNIDPKNPTELTAANLEALDKLSTSMNKCPYGSLPDGACKQSHLNFNETYGKAGKTHVQTEIFDPRLNAHRAKAMRELSNGRLFSKNMNGAMSALKKENLKIQNNKKTPSLSSYKKLAALGGMNLGKENFMDATDRSWANVKKALASNGKFQNLIGNSPTTTFNKDSKKDQEQSANSPSINTARTTANIETGAPKKLEPNQFKFEWNDDPNVSDRYHDMMKKEADNIVKNGVMPEGAGISKRKDQNLFHIISRRYLISGYKALQIEEVKD